MSLRPAAPADEPIMASICAAAWFEESLFGETMHPLRHKYPDDMKIYWRKRIQNEFRDPRTKLLVATVPEGDEEKIVGVSAWQRQGDDEGAKKVMSEWADIGPDPFPPFPSTHNRAIDPKYTNILSSSYPFFQHHWQPTTNSVPRSLNWHLNMCAVDPAYQGRGIGKLLVQWGLQRAREENVHASTTSSHETEPFYLGAGFDEIVGNCSEGEGNPLAEAGVKGGAILFMWAKDKEASE